MVVACSRFEAESYVRLELERMRAARLAAQEWLAAMHSTQSKGRSENWSSSLWVAAQAETAVESVLVVIVLALAVDPVECYHCFADWSS